MKVYWLVRNTAKEQQYLKDIEAIKKGTQSCKYSLVFENATQALQDQEET